MLPAWSVDKAAWSTRLSLTDNLPGKPLRPYLVIFCYLAAATFLHAWLTLAVVEDSPQGLASISEQAKTPVSSPQAPKGQSQYVKSNQFMLKDAVCNYTNGDLVCHRAVGLRHISELTGS